MSLRSNGVLISVTVLATIIFFAAVPGNCLPNNEIVATMDNETVPTMDNKTRLSIEFIQMKEEEFQLGPEKEAVVILGRIFAGKSTLSLLLTNGEMKSTKFGTYYKFVDENNRICNRNYCDFTLPVTDTFNNITYYDWCAFQDSLSNTSVEVLTSHLLKKFARSEKSAKFVFAIPETDFDITDHTSIDKSPDWLASNSPFVQLAAVASDLFVNIDKYRNAIGFVVTRSSEIILRNNFGKLIRSDVDPIIRVIHYLKSLREGLTDYLNRNDDRVRYYNVNGIIGFIDVLLEKKDGKYKIGVFKRPRKAGLAKELEIIQDEKIAIQSMIANQLQFVKCDADDFGYAVEYYTKQKDLYRNIMLNLKQ